MINKDKCIACGMCESVCPVGAISLASGKAEINPDMCVKCHTCESVCPVGAIKIED